MPKCYHATFLLGRRSETDDVEGAVSELQGVPVPTRAMVEAALPHFLGEIEQRPPAHSAVKVGGRRAYELARQGKSVEIVARRVQIYQLEVQRYEYPELGLAIRCGSGTYVRALGRDLAESLGTAAVMSALVRTAIGGFRVEDALAMEELSPQTVEQHLKPAIAAVGDMPRITLNDAHLNDIRHGRPIQNSKAHDSASPSVSRPGLVAEWAALNSAGQLVAILIEKTDGRLWPRHYFGD